MADGGALSRFRRALGRAVGRLRDALPGGRDREAAAGYRCDICETPVEDAEGPCPLCQSIEIVPAGPATEPGDEEEEGLTGKEARRTRVADDGAPEASLSALQRDRGDLLARHADRWEERGGGSRRYAVQRPDGGVTFVESKDDVRSLLWRDRDAWDEE